VFADPPYAVADEEIGALLAGLRDHGWLAPGALVAVERATRSGPVAWPAGFTSDRCRRYGEATLWYGLAAGRSLAGDPAGPQQTGA
jgi:16S rRNA (guanine966-N2)-methyltransferase